MKKLTTYLIIMLLTTTLKNCSTVDKIQGVYKVESKDYSSTITLYTDSTFIEKRNGKIESKKYRGHWQYIMKADSIIETSIESSGMTIYTMTPKTKYKIKGERMIEITGK